MAHQQLHLALLVAASRCASFVGSVWTHPRILVRATCDTLPPHASVLHVQRERAGVRCA